MDNSNDPLNTTEKLFSEKMPESLRQSILAQAQSELSTVRNRERFKTISYFFGGLVTASVVGVNITRNLMNSKDPSAPSQNALAAQDLELEESLSSEIEVADWQDVDFELMADLDDVENLTEEEFAYISSEEDV